MKNKNLLGLLIFVATCVVFSFVFVGCTHKHNYKTLKFDDFQHWYECSCGEIDGILVHTSESSCLEEAICSVCNHCFDEYGWHVADQDGLCKYCDMPESTPNLKINRAPNGEYYAGGMRENCEETDIVIGFYQGKTVTRITGTKWNGPDIPWYFATSITLGDGIREIDEGTFNKCEKLKRVTIGNGVLTIGKEAFYNCTSLESINIPNSVTNIGKEAFYNCKKLESIALGDGVTVIGDSIFWCCSLLKDVTLGKNLQIIGHGAFINCTNLTSIVIPDSVTEIGERVFEYCINLTQVTLGSGLTKISHKLFMSCQSLETIVIPSGVTEIDIQAFYGCTSLKNIVLYSNIKSVGSSAFVYCDNLSNVYYVGDETQWGETTIDYNGTSNEELAKATVFYYSQTQPTTDGNYWHFDTDGKTPLVWQMPE